MRESKILDTRDGVIGYLCALVGLSLFAMKGIVIKLGYDEQLDAEVTLMWRMMLAMPFYVGIGIWMWGKRPEARIAFKRREVWLTTCVCGVMSYYLASYLDFKGLEYVSAQFERITLYTYPFFVLMFSCLLIGAKMTWIAFASLVLSYIGVITMYIHDIPAGEHHYPLGTAYVLGAALVISFQQVLSKSVIEALGSRLFTSIALTISSLAVMAHFMISHSFDALLISQHAMVLMFILAVFCTVIPTYLINEAVRRIGPQHASSVGGIGPVVTTIAAVFILGESFTIWHGVGTALVLIGVGLFTRHKA
ncbi:MAG: DMT family transporter [Rickettsiales bacterium]|nr:DMT family transporter [Rickettsiales bacterium]